MSQKRKAWIDEIRFRVLQQYDEVLAQDYDDKRGNIDLTHKAYVQEVLDSLPKGAAILDAACGTGKYWPLLEEMDVTGVDQSQGMLDKLEQKFPNAQTSKQNLQHLNMGKKFDAALCIDAMENIPPDDWAHAINNLRNHLNEGGLLYLTVKQTEEQEIRNAFDEAKRLDLPVIPGEVALDGYHFYPLDLNVRRWLSDYGFEVIKESRGDGYWHLLCKAI